MLVILAIAVSIAGVGGVHGAATLARETLSGDSRAWLAGDIGIDTRDTVNASQQAGLDRLGRADIEWTVITTTVTMASSTTSPDPGLINVKAIDPRKYPFYGGLILNPAKSPRELLDADTVAVSPDVLDRLHMAIGDAIRIAGQTFRISSVIQAEPDRFSGSVGLGMRCLLSREGYARTGLEDSGVALRNRVLLRLPAAANLDSARHLLEQLFPGGSIRDYRQAYRRQTESVISFLTVTSFLALILGAAGIGIAMRHHAGQRLPTLAILRTLGAADSQLAVFFLVQTAWITAAALAAGVVLGLAIRAAIVGLAGKYLSLAPSNGWGLAAVLETAAAAGAILIPVLIQPAWMVGHFPPAALLRSGPELFSAARTRLSWVATALTAIALGSLAFSMMRVWSSAIVLLAALAACVAVSWLLTAAAFRLLRHYSIAWKHLPLLFHGIANLYRPGNRSRFLMVALATTIAILIATFEASGAVVQALFDILPYERDSLYIARFKLPAPAALRAFLERQPGVENVQIIAQTRLQLRGIGGPRPKAFLKSNVESAIDSPQAIICDPNPSAAPSEDTSVIVAEDTASLVGLTTGTLLEMDGPGYTLHARVAAVRKFPPAEKVWGSFRMDCSPVGETGLYYQAAVRIRGDQVARVRHNILSEYPQLAVLTPEEISETVTQVTEDAMMLARVVTWCAIGAGLAMLIASIAATRTSRLREIGVLSVLGARRSAIVCIYTIEFAAMGLLSGVMGALLSCGFHAAVLSIVFQRVEFAPTWPAIAVIPICALCSIAAGWLPTHNLLKRNPAQILRGVRSSSYQV